MEPDDDFELVARLRTGDPAAFDVIYAHYHARVFSFLRRMSQSRDIAEDLAEETWLRLVSSSADLAIDTRLGPWLFTVARNLFLSHCRSRLRHESYTADLILLWPSELPRTPHDVAAHNQFTDRLEAALAALPPAWREAVLLVAERDLRPSDAAAVCGITPEAFRQRLSRARAALSEKLALKETVK